MRSDFGKIVTEKPRRGSGNRNAKVREFGKIVLTEDGPEYFGYTKIPSSMNGKGYGYDSKDFTDVLGPIHGYLKNSVGKPWDSVNSEMMRVLGRGTWPVRHILKDHVHVAIHTYRDGEGAIWVQDKGGESKVGGYRSEFYVEPETGILREAPIRRRHFYRQKPEPDIRIQRHSGNLFLVQIAGIWYLGVYKAWGIKPLLGFEFPNTEAGYFVKHKQASKKDLRKLK